MFIRQSLYSDYCAVYSVGMALSMLGIDTDRKGALSLFDVKKGWKGASHDDIDAALIKATGGKGSAWYCTNQSLSGQNAFFWLHYYARSILDPIIVTASCRLVQHDLVCGHAFLITGGSSDGIFVLDPLAKRPLEGKSHNIVITLNECGAEKISPVGCRWEMLCKHPIYCKRIAVSG